MTMTASSVWIDVNGWTRLTIVSSLAGASGVDAALQAASLATMYRFWESGETLIPPSPSAGTYQAIFDAAILTFQDAGGNLVRVTLPAPSSAIFLADQMTVDPTNGLVVAIVAAVVGSVVTSAGGLVTAYVAGTRQRGSKEA